MNQVSSILIYFIIIDTKPKKDDDVFSMNANLIDVDYVTNEVVNIEPEAEARERSVKSIKNVESPEGQNSKTSSSKMFKQLTVMDIPSNNNNINNQGNKQRLSKDYIQNHENIEQTMLQAKPSKSSNSELKTIKKQLTNDYIQQAIINKNQNMCKQFLDDIYVSATNSKLL